MMECPCRSSSLARAKTDSAPSPLITDIRDAMDRMHSPRSLQRTIYNPLYMPPSTRIVCPVMYDARSEASQTIVSATSRGSPNRLSGASAAQASKISCSLFPDADDRAAANSFKRSVAVNPGPTLFTRIPSLPNSLARLFTRPTTAARTAFERTRSVTGCLVVIDVSVMMRPQRFLCMCGITSRAKYTLLRKFVSRARRHSARSRQRNPLAGGARRWWRRYRCLRIFADSGDQVANGRRVGHVKGLGKNVHVMLLSDLLRRGLQNLLVARAHADAATLRGERFRRGPTNSLTRGCDQRDSIFQSKIHEAGIINGT